jgi:long-chain acyl-CoA synthetase
MKELVYHRHLLPAVERYTNKVGFIDGDYRGTYERHLDRVARLCAALKSLGTGRADRFAVMALNGHRFLELYHAALLGAGIINPLNLRFSPRELEYVLRDSGSKVCFVDATFAPILDQVRKAAGVEQVVLLGDGDVPHDHAYEPLIAAATPRIPDEPEETDPVVLMYTGGTTGLPKGVLCDQRAELLNVYHVRMRHPHRESAVTLLQLPMFHAGVITDILGNALGATSVFMPRFDPGQVPALIEKEHVTQTSMAPTMIAMMVAHPGFRPERLATLTELAYGASPMPDALLQRLMTLLPHVDLYQGYGMTEASCIVSILQPEDHRNGGAILRSAGRAVPGVVISIQDEGGNVLPPGTTGEVCVRAGNAMIGYWNNRSATEEAFRGGWYHTGDAGYLDDSGYLFLVDRVKDMIVTGGENVYSIEVENAIASHPAVAQVAAIGIPHDTWGEAVHAIVVLRDGARATEEELIAHARSSIAGYKVPRSIELRTQPLPLSAAMKVLKRELRAPYWEGKNRGVN